MKHIKRETANRVAAWIRQQKQMRTHRYIQKLLVRLKKKNMGWKSFLEIEETLCKYMRNDYPVLEIAAISEKIK